MRSREVSCPRSHNCLCFRASSWTHVKNTYNCRWEYKVGNAKFRRCTQRIKQTWSGPPPPALKERNNGSGATKGQLYGNQEHGSLHIGAPHAWQYFLLNESSFVGIFIYFNLMPTFAWFQNILFNSSYGDTSTWKKRLMRTGVKTEAITYLASPRHRCYLYPVSHWNMSRVIGPRDPTLSNPY